MCVKRPDRQSPLAGPTDCLIGNRILLSTSRPRYQTSAGLRVGRSRTPETARFRSQSRAMGWMQNVRVCLTSNSAHDRSAVAGREPTLIHTAIIGGPLWLALLRFVSTLAGTSMAWVGAVLYLKRSFRLLPCWWVVFAVACVCETPPAPPLL